MAGFGAAAGMAASHVAAAGGLGGATALSQTVEADVKHAPSRSRRSSRSSSSSRLDHAEAGRQAVLDR